MRKATVPLLILTCLWSCSRPEEQLRPLVVLEITPPGGARVYLNEPLVVTFDQEVDLASITRQSARVLSEGTAIPGRWEVDGVHLTFWPKPILRSDRMDGGYRPGLRHSLVLTGFPRPDGIRAQGGAHLAQTLRHDFVAKEIRPGPSLFDLSMDPGRCEPLRPPGTAPGAPLLLQRGEAIVLVCDEPLDPSSLVSEEFWIEADISAPGTQQGVLGRVAGLHARLVQNNHFQSLATGSCARIQFWPDARLSEGGYLLRGVPQPSLMDMGGNLAWSEAEPITLARLRILPRGFGPDSTIRLDFLDAHGKSPQRIPWADGTATWSDRGELSVALPAASGDGHEGVVVLTGEQTQGQREAIQLTVPAGSKAEFLDNAGLVILRSQGSLRIDGSLLRQRQGQAGDPVQDHGSPDQPVLLSVLLDQALASGREWTVLIAGGDLIITGEVQVDTPLILVAGGRVRINGSVRCKSEHLHLLGEGGGLDLPGIPSSLPGVLVDQPHLNPLQKPLLFAAISSPLPREVSQRYDWGRLVVGGREGTGRWRVGFLPADVALERELVVRHPGLLQGEGSVRVLVELEVLPGGVWDPPALDFLRLDWEAPESLPFAR